jgi:hypothetical protein
MQNRMDRTSGRIRKSEKDKKERGMPMLRKRSRIIKLFEPFRKLILLLSGVIALAMYPRIVDSFYVLVFGHIISQLIKLKEDRL